mmetsp:Transcript_41789/g.81703  ORF Transcript_41789/g.81703 Transcript_41789/m.81703 type:complete len:103 (-) Transcript_41789:901-1209(-)
MGKEGRRSARNELVYEAALLGRTMPRVCERSHEYPDYTLLKREVDTEENHAEAGIVIEEATVPTDEPENATDEESPWYDRGDWGITRGLGLVKGLGWLVSRC